MSDQDGYNGWTNYETWATALWIDNEEGSYGEARRIVSEVVTTAVQSEWDQAHAGRCANALKDWAEEWFIDPFTEDSPAGLHADLLRAAWSEVNWYEIAENMLQELADA